MQQKLVNFYQFLYHVTPVVILQVKSWNDSTFHSFVHWELVATLLKDNPAFYLVIIQSLKGTALIRQITNNECLRGNVTRISQFISIFVSRDPCFYLSSKKLV